MPFFNEAEFKKLLNFWLEFDCGLSKSNKLNQSSQGVIRQSKESCHEGFYFNRVLFVSLLSWNVSIEVLGWICLYWAISFFIEIDTGVSQRIKSLY